eukprot:evm.model.scf_240EXC.2 EVM.evm.TU.scf_240EXC.2   scf_240EXC:28604-31037(-)
MEDYGAVVKDLLRLPLALRPGDRLIPKVVEDALSCAEGVDRSPRSTLTGFASEGSDAPPGEDWTPGPAAAESRTPRPNLADSWASGPRRVEARFHFAGVYDGHGGAEVARQVAKNLHLHLKKAFGIVAATSLTQSVDEHAPWASQPKAVDGISRGADATRRGADVTRRDGDATRRGRDSETSRHSRHLPRGRDLTDALSRHRGLNLPQVRDAVELAFCLMDGQLRGTEAARLAGSTAVVALVSGSVVCVANVGDSRAVLSRGGAACRLTRDHKPYLEDEEVALIETSPDDDFLILATDGLWDTISDAEAVELTHRCFDRALAGAEQVKLTHGGPRQLGAEIAAKVLIKAATDRGSRDNITVTVVDLKGNCEL